MAEPVKEHDLLKDHQAKAYSKDTEARGGRAFSNALLDEFQDLAIHVSGVIALCLTDDAPSSMVKYETPAASLQCVDGARTTHGFLRQGAIGFQDGSPPEDLHMLLQGYRLEGLRLETPGREITYSAAKIPYDLHLVVTTHVLPNLV